MKQKIVMKVQMSCQKCRTKALEIAASSDGAEKVSIEGDEKDQVVVIGDGIDPIRLIKCLKKRVGHAQILNLNEVKPDSKVQEEGKTSSTDHIQFFQYHSRPHFVGYDMVHEPTPSFCSVM